MPQPGKPPTAPAVAQAPQQNTPPDDKAALDDILNRIETERGRPAIVYWTSALAKISIGVELPLFDQLKAVGKQQALDLILFTGGGDTEAPIRIVSLIREFCDSLSVVIPHAAMSAGTCIALGADEIVMTPLSVLGPIDPSRSHPLLPKREGAAEPEQISVQDLRHAMQFIRDAAATDTSSGLAYTPEAMAQIFSALFDKIHPLAIGAIEQSYALAKLVGTRCLETHMGTSDVDREKTISIVDKLCDQYKTHSYPISRREAASIGLKVVPATASFEPLILDLYKIYAARKVGPFGGPVVPGKELEMHIAWLDSLRIKFRAVQKREVNAKKELEARGDQWLLY